MEVCVLGSGVGVPSVKRSSPGLFIKTDTEGILVDPGPGSVRRLLKFGFNYIDVDSIILTHFHPDHCLDYISFLFACRYPLEPRREDLFVVGPTGLKHFHDSIISTFAGAITPETFTVNIREVTDEVIVRDKAQLTIKEVSHGEHAIGIRYRDAAGSILCYSGDTDYCDNIVELARKADLLILECSFPEGGKVDGHLTPTYAGRVAEEAGVERLVLTHLYPVCEKFDILSQCKQTFTGRVDIASDLTKILC